MRDAWDKLKAIVADRIEHEDEISLHQLRMMMIQLEREASNEKHEEINEKI